MSSPWQSILLSQVPPGNRGRGPKGADFNNQLSRVGWKSICQFLERKTLTGSDIKLSVWYQQAHTTPKNVTTGSQKWRQGRPSTLQHRSPRFQSPQYYPSSESHGFSSSHGWMWKLDHKEDWASKNWYFRTVVLERVLTVPWTVRRSNQSISKEVNSEYSLEGLMLKLQYFGHLMQRANSLEKTLWKIEGRRRMGQQRMRWLYGITD